MTTRPILFSVLAIGFARILPAAAAGGAPCADEIVRRSVAANQADWKAAPAYSFTERDVESHRGGVKTVKIYRTLMLFGSPYRRLIGVDDRPLSKQQDARERSKLKAEATRRSRQSPAGRARRIAKYAQERKQDQSMLLEMAAGFQYKLVGDDKLDGHDVWVLEASPRPGYAPKTRETKVLTSMRGKLWIDKARYQWVKVEAEVFRPVTYGMFIAKVGPGTKFELEQAPVADNVWMPTHFSTTVRASVLGFSDNSTDDEGYRDYKPNQSALLEAMAE